MACGKEPCAHVASAIKYATVAFSVIGLWLSWFSMKVLQNEQTLIRAEERQKYIIKRQDEIIDKIKEIDRGEHESTKIKRDSNDDHIRSN